jgi:hypothetical protein
VLSRSQLGPQRGGQCREWVGNASEGVGSAVAGYHSGLHRRLPCLSNGDGNVAKYLPVRQNAGPQLFVILGGAIVGFLTWFIGLIADRAFLRRLVLTVILSVLGFTLSFVLVHCADYYKDYLRSTGFFGFKGGLHFFAVIAGPLVGAMFGCYWLWGKLRTKSAVT